MAAKKKYKMHKYAILECEDGTLIRLNSIESYYFKNSRSESPAVMIQTNSGAIHTLQKVENEEEARIILDSCIDMWAL